MRWFRLYTEARTDAKLLSLTDAEFRVWFNLLCYAADQDERGSIDASNWFKLAVEVAGGNEDLLTTVVDKLTKLDILARDGAILRFIHFEERQYDKPSDRPEAVRERVRRYRERSAATETPVERHVTPSNACVTPGNAGETFPSSPSPYLSPNTPTDADADTEGEGAGEPPSASQPAAEEAAPTADKSSQQALEAEYARLIERYPVERRAEIDDYWSLMATTRKAGRVALSVKVREMTYWARYPPNIVLEALGIHRRRYHTKQEDYTRGIMRRLYRERQRQPTMDTLLPDPQDDELQRVAREMRQLAEQFRSGSGGAAAGP